MKIKKLFCKFANWILRKCVEPTTAFNNYVYINGRTYQLIKATTEISPYSYYTINFEVISGNQ